jgi:hypothetical protein
MTASATLENYTTLTDATAGLHFLASPVSFRRATQTYKGVALRLAQVRQSETQQDDLAPCRQ